MCWGRAGALGQGALASWDSNINLLLLLHFIRCVVQSQHGSAAYPRDRASVSTPLPHEDAHPTYV